MERLYDIFLLSYIILVCIIYLYFEVGLLTGNVTTIVLFILLSCFKLEWRMNL